jgi:hypothetical protein
MLCLSSYYLCLLFNKIGEKGRTGSVWERGRGEEGGRNDPNNVCTYEYMNKEKMGEKMGPKKDFGGKADGLQVIHSSVISGSICERWR